MSELTHLAAEVSVCTKCILSRSRVKSVPGEGPENASIMFIGEGPGFNENQQGRPFVGAAGKFLEELLQSIGLKRDQVYITNVVKCRPPGNRDPQPEELGACGEYLERQIEAINPRVIVTLGRYSMARFMPNVKISDVHGQPFMRDGRLIVPMFHPAAALHQPALKTSVERDFARLTESHPNIRSILSRNLRARLSAADIVQDGETGVLFPHQTAESLIEAVRLQRGPRENLHGWLIGTASHVTADHLRSSYRHPQDGLKEDLVSEIPLPAAEVESREHSESVQDALACLTDEQQHVITLRFGQGHSIEETAEIMNKNINAVKALQFRALAALHEQQQDHWTCQQQPHGGWQTGLIGHPTDQPGYPHPHHFRGSGRRE